LSTACAKRGRDERFTHLKGGSVVPAKKKVAKKKVAKKAVKKVAKKRK
jgi:hypothetical protein